MDATQRSAVLAELVRVRQETADLVKKKKRLAYLTSALVKDIKEFASSHNTKESTKEILKTLLIDHRKRKLTQYEELSSPPRSVSFDNGVPVNLGPAEAIEEIVRAPAEEVTVPTDFSVLAEATHRDFRCA